MLTLRQLTYPSYSSKYELIYWYKRFEKKIQFDRVYNKLTHTYLLAHVICLFSFLFFVEKGYHSL